MANVVGVDGKAGRYEFYGGAEGILPRICRLHPSIKRSGTFPAGDISRGIDETDTVTKRLIFAGGFRCRDEPLKLQEKRDVNTA